MFVFDANSFTTPWDAHYPKEIFPSLWSKLAQNNSNITLIKPIFDQIDPNEKSGLRDWLLSEKFTGSRLEKSVEDCALILQRDYQIKNTGKGADENDIMLIAHAKFFSQTVVTYEAKQLQQPSNRSNYKIPLICSNEGVKCTTFVECLQELKIII